MVGLLLAGVDDLDGVLLPADGVERLDDVQGHDHAALHVQHAGAVGLAVDDLKGLGLAEGAGVVHRVDVAGEDDGLAGAILAQDADQHAGAVGGYFADVAAEALLLKAALDIVPSLLDVFLLVVMAFEIDKFLPGLNDLVAVGVNIGGNLIVVAIHVISPFQIM